MEAGAQFSTIPRKWHSGRSKSTCAAARLLGLEVNLGSGTLVCGSLLAEGSSGVPHLDSLPANRSGLRGRRHWHGSTLSHVLDLSFEGNPFGDFQRPPACRREPVQRMGFRSKPLIAQPRAVDGGGQVPSEGVPRRLVIVQEGTAATGTTTAVVIIPDLCELKNRQGKMCEGVVMRFIRCWRPQVVFSLARRHLWAH